MATHDFTHIPVRFLALHTEISRILRAGVPVRPFTLTKLFRERSHAMEGRGPVWNYQVLGFRIDDCGTFELSAIDAASRASQTEDEVAWQNSLARGYPL